MKILMSSLALMTLLFWQLSWAEKIYDPTHRPDNLTEKYQESTGSADLLPEMVFTKNGKSSVIIKGKTYQVGDMVGRFKILRITPNQLDFLSGKTKREIFIEPNLVEDARNKK